ncbi:MULTISPECIES: large-conductance mechanosensitive channel protein MscL [unclassified Desulfurobacterium]|uniref:large-conductance mechanosensitive channel protein MscL n=1 Tax=Desulfurobacterium sp. TC5-1 TaxID=1158318 RepID=UPI0003B451B9|nr:large-conductance mechanosensitive channel protein MscL [Desulfurobacterium sp. TC5-1]
MGMLKEFKNFAMRGNVIDMAVGIIIGAAFGKIVSSFVGDVLMPVIGLLIGGVNFTSLSISVGKATIKYGKFIQSVVDFTIIAFAIFLAIKAINSLKKKEEEKPSTPPAPSKEEILLSEIRDLLMKMAEK